MNDNVKIYVTFLFFFLFTNSFGQKAPASVTSAIVVKILQLEKSINSSGELNIYIIGAPDVTAELKKVVGKKVGDVTIKSIESGDKLPAAKPSAIFCDNSNLAESLSKYAATNKIVTLTRDKSIGQSFSSVLIDITEDGKPLILISPSASKAQELDWNPAIFKIAKKIQ